MDQTWALRHSEVIDSRTICTAMDDLENEHMEQDSEGDWVAIPVERWPAERQAEFTEYDRILTEVKGNSPSLDVSANGDAVTLVNESYFTEYVKEECGELYGGNLYEPDGRWGHTYKHITGSRLVELLPQLEFVDWEEYAEDQKKYYAEIEINGITYFYAGY